MKIGAEKPPIAFICELKKQVRNGLLLRGEGQSAVSDRAGAAHGTHHAGRPDSFSAAGPALEPAAGTLTGGLPRVSQPGNVQRLTGPKIDWNSNSSAPVFPAYSRPAEAVESSKEQHHARNGRSVARATEAGHSESAILREAGLRSRASSP